MKIIYDSKLQLNTICYFRSAVELSALHWPIVNQLSSFLQTFQLLDNSLLVPGHIININDFRLAITGLSAYNGRQYQCKSIKSNPKIQRPQSTVTVIARALSHPSSCLMISFLCVLQKVTPWHKKTPTYLGWPWSYQPTVTVSSRAPTRSPSAAASGTSCSSTSRMLR